MNDWIIVKNEKSNYLAHYGIEKQKWGVRHGPPYPLDYEDHSKAQKKEISKYKFTSKKSQLPPKQRKGKDVNSSKSNKTVISSSKKFDKRWKEQGFLNDFVNDVIREEQDIVKGKNVVDALTRSIQGNWRRDPNNPGNTITTYWDENWVQPNDDNTHYNNITEGFLNRDFNNINKVNGTNNCVGCSVAAELLSHGLRGVGAAMSKYGNNTREVVKKYFDGYDDDKDRVTCNTVGSDIEDVLREKFGNNSSGILTGSRTKSNSQGSKVRVGGHAMHFTIDNDGNVEVQDAQSHKRYSSILQACKAEGFDINYKGGTEFYNLANTNPNVTKLRTGGLITTTFDNISGLTSEQVYRPYGAKNAFDITRNYDEARKETAKNIVNDYYEKYKQYKKENYWDKEDDWDNDDW